MLGSVARSVFGAFGLEVVRRSTHRGVSLQADLIYLLRDRPGVLIDAGANVGEFSQDLARWFPGRTIIAFEPIPSTFKQLQANVGSNGTIRPECLALGELSQTAHMVARERSVESRVVSNGSRDTLPVAMKRIDDYCREASISQIALLKTDCEGYDANVVRGTSGLLAEGRIDAVYCEVNFRRDGKHGDFFAIHEQLDPQFLFYGLYEYSSRTGPDFCNGLWVRNILIKDSYGTTP